MTTATLSALLWSTLALAAILLVAVVWLGIAHHRLRRSTAELTQELESKPAVHPSVTADGPGRLVAVVVNPTKDPADDVVRQIHSACSRAGMPAPLVMASSAEDPGHEMTRRALEAGAVTVIAAGGDGTVRAVAAEIVGTQTALGIVPLGTGNLFARNIGLPFQDLRACVDEAIHGRSHRVDTLDLSLERPDGRTDEENSLVIAGGGLDAEVMGDTRDALKQRAGWLAYGEAGLRHIMGSRSAISVSIDDGAAQAYRVRSVLLANCGSLQANMLLVPSAKFDDGHMDAVLFTPRHAWDWARIMAKTVTRFAADIPVMTVRQAKRVKITMAEPMPFQIDGDAMGEVISVSARVRPRALVVNGVSVRGIQDIEAAHEDSEADQASDHAEQPRLTEGRITKEPQGG
ncbi:sphingosine kinase [Nesterenkonia sp. LB17]|uniref:diacylglycerol/lipid kinase family protein n=1 Tax=unclassified Nesterenkonia TaxID=2629769 RepID=UPI001F4CFE96|nr:MULTISPECIES: diacylglycerol kinase family protein [unclassified Nesterenkonia]MCH8560995.1 sphingosine kinase [Nesterenkonia sp. DZ6]MCH8566045.1 sphingosine kinase [Nesterenkonia sp. LB17]